MNDEVVAVLGAGPAGLMAALRLAEQGQTCVVFEAADQVGGMAGSFEVAGVRVDFGSHRLHPATPPALLDRIKAVMGDDLQLRPRRGRLRLRDRWVGFPFRPTDLARTMPPQFAARVAIDTATGPLRTIGRRPPASFAEAIRHRLGPTVAREFYDPYARKLYGAAPDELSVELARRRVSARSPVAIVQSMLTPTPPERRGFWYPRRGYGQISERLAEEATAAGVDIRLGAPVEKVDVSADSVAVTVGTDGEERVMSAGHVISTIPLPTLASRITPEPPVEVMDALGRLRTRAMVLVYLVVDAAQYTPFDAHYLAGLDTAVARLSEPKNYRTNPDDPADRTVLCAEIACWPNGDDPIWTATDADLGELVADDLVRAGLPRPAVVAVESRRLPSVYPVYDIRAEPARAVVDTWIRSPSRVRITGRQGLGVPDNLHHVMEMGQQAASVSPGNATAWATALDVFASNVVED